MIWCGRCGGDQFDNQCGRKFPLHLQSASPHLVSCEKEKFFSHLQLACICGQVKKGNNFVLAKECNSICWWNNSPVQINYVNFHWNWTKQKTLQMFETLRTSHNIGFRRGKHRWRCKLSKQCQLWTFPLSFCQSGRCMLNLWGYSSNRQYGPLKLIKTIYYTKTTFKEGFRSQFMILKESATKSQIFSLIKSTVKWTILKHSKINYIKT